MPMELLQNPQIMKVIQESFGRLHDKYNPNNRFQGNSPIPNAPFIFTGDRIVPIPSTSSGSHNEIVSQSNSVARHCAKSQNVSVKIEPKDFNFKRKSDHVEAQENVIMPSPTNPVEKQSKIIKTEQNKSDSKQILPSVPSISTDWKKHIFVTGTIERLLRWNKTLKDVSCQFETIAPVISIQEGRLPQQKIMLLRDKKGPILQVQYYTNTHIDIEDFHIDQYLRCVGRMIGYNILSAESIRAAKENEIASLPRLSCVCDYSINHKINSNNE